MQASHLSLNFLACAHTSMQSYMVEGSICVCLVCCVSKKKGELMTVQ